MKKSLVITIILLLCLALLSAGALAETATDTEPFSVIDGYIVGTYAPESDASFVEIRINDMGAGAGMGAVSIKWNAEPGEYGIEVFCDGVSVLTQTLTVEEAAATPEPTATPEPSAPPAEEPVYQLTLTADEGGTIPAGLDQEISGSYKAGETVSLIARPMPGYRFSGWVSSAGGEFEDASSSGTTFTMPANDVTVTARFEPLTPPEPPVVTISEDGRTASVTGDFTGLYARAAIVIENGSRSGLYVTQVVINPDGSVVIPVFEVPGLTVKGVNIALVRTLEDITSPKPDVVCSASQMAE